MENPWTHPVLGQVMSGDEEETEECKYIFPVDDASEVDLLEQETGDIMSSLVWFPVLDV